MVFFWSSCCRFIENIVLSILSIFIDKYNDDSYIYMNIFLIRYNFKLNNFKEMYSMC